MQPPANAYAFRGPGYDAVAYGYIYPATDGHPLTYIHAYPCSHLDANHYPNPDRYSDPFPHPYAHPPSLGRVYY